jgi:hypothetical protein
MNKYFGNTVMADEFTKADEQFTATAIETARSRKKATEIYQRIESLPVSLLNIGGYQRHVSNVRVARIIANCDPAKLGLIVVNKREDGSYYVIDGQHRLAALRRMGVELVRCILVVGLTAREEAEYFRTQDCCVRALTAFDAYIAGVIAQDQHYLTLQYLLDKHGYRVARYTGSSAKRSPITKYT